MLGAVQVEPNPEFVQDLKAASGGKGVILACEAGGSLRPTPSFQFGKASRSLSASYRCTEPPRPCSLTWLMPIELTHSPARVSTA